MKINTLEIAFDANGAHAIIWVRCVSVLDCDKLIRWLDMTGNVMEEWERIRAEVARPPQAATSKNEDHESREVEPAPSTQNGTDGIGAREETEVA